jgi:hypothetical protein
LGVRLTPPLFQPNAGVGAGDYDGPAAPVADVGRGLLGASAAGHGHQVLDLAGVRPLLVESVVIKISSGVVT